MQKKEYYCLVAGLPDLLFIENKLALKSLNLREELQFQLRPSDYKLVEILFLPFDNQNLLNLLYKRNTPFETRGLYTKDILNNQLELSEEEIQLPAYMIQFIHQIRTSGSKDFSVDAVNKLHALYYEFVLSCENQFLKNWLLFDLNIRNILTAFNCIRFSYPLEEQLLTIQENETSYSLLLNKRLKPELFNNELPFCEQIFRIAESDAETIEKEKTLDKIRWDYLDEYTFFHYFTIEKILSFVLKLFILERWMKLDAESGRQLLDRLIDDLKTSYEFPAEFSCIKKTG